MLYSINNNDKLIQYDRDPIPLDINYIDYLEFEINDFTYILTKDDIEYIFGGFIDNYINDYPSENKYRIFLEKMNDVLLDIDNFTLEELYDELEDPYSIELDEWFLLAIISLTNISRIKHPKKLQNLFISVKSILGMTSTLDLLVKVH